MSDEVVTPDIDLLDTDALMSRPDPRWIIKDILPEGDFSVLWGHAGQGKSFVALDWAAAIAMGIPWQEKYPTLKGPVVYIAAEGASGMKLRLDALMRKLGVWSIPGLYFLIKPLYVREEGVVEAFLDLLAGEDMFPRLIIIDTLSRSFGGGEENSSADMGHFIQRMTKLAHDRYSTVLVLHHSNASGGRERGHTSLKGGAQSMLHCEGIVTDKGHLQGVVIVTDKQKDAPGSDSLYLRAEPLRKSLVLYLDEMPKKAQREITVKPHVMPKVDMVTYLGGHPEGLRFTEWELGAQVPHTTFVKRVAQLLREGTIMKESNGRYFVTPTTHDIAERDSDED